MEITITRRAKIISDKCEGRGSIRFFRSSIATALMLLKRGYTDEEAEAIMCSDLMREAANTYTARKYKIPVLPVSKYLDGLNQEWLAKYITKCVEEARANT